MSKVTHVTIDLAFRHDGTPENESRIARAMNDMSGVINNLRLKEWECAKMETKVRQERLFGGWTNETAKVHYNRPSTSSF